MRDAVALSRSNRRCLIHPSVLAEKFTSGNRSFRIRRTAMGLALDRNWLLARPLEKRHAALARSRTPLRRARPGALRFPAELHPERGGYARRPPGSLHQSGPGTGI